MGHIAIINTDLFSPGYNTVVATVSVPTNEGDIVVSPDGANAYVTAIFANVISVLPLPVA